VAALGEEMNSTKVTHGEEFIHNDKDEDGVRKEFKKPRLVSYLWDTFDKPPDERKLLAKLDAGIISFASIGKWCFVALNRPQLLRIAGYFLKSIDQYNINNAFVSGMYVGTLFNNGLC
jgi:hypothetical protein